MTLEIFDLLWNIPILFFSLGGCWKLWRNPPGTPIWYLWPWYAGGSVTWEVNAVLEYVQGDAVWTWISLGAVVLEWYIAVVYFHEHRLLQEEIRQRQAHLDGFEKFRIDK